MYELHYLKSAIKELKKLDKPTAQRLTSRASWLAANIENVHLHPLTGEFSGLYKLREGSYRIIYQILHKENLVVIDSVGHRKDVYKLK